MTNPARKLVDWWFAPVPAERLAAFRIVVGAFATVYLAVRIGHLLDVTHLPRGTWRPVGVVDVLVDEPLRAGPWTALVAITVALSVAFTAGVAHRVVAPVFAALLLFVLTYRSSWGMPFHTENLLVLHVIVLALAPAADAWSIDRRRAARRAVAPPAADGRYAWALRTAAVLLVVTYVIAGLAKIRLAGGDWLDGDQLRNQVAHDNIRKALLGDTISPIASPLLDHPILFQILAVATLAVEIGAPIALAGGRYALVWCGAAWGFHVGVIALMAIAFPYPLAGVAYAPLFAVERPVGWLLRRGWRRRSAAVS
jgi:hypothetical protein